MNYSQEKCIKYAIQVANMAGFTNSQVTVKPKPKEYPSSQFYSYTPNGPYAFAVNCDEKTGTAAFAISGIIAERTDQLFTKIIRTYDEVIRWQAQSRRAVAVVMAGVRVDCYRWTIIDQIC